MKEKNTKELAMIYVSDMMFQSKWVTLLNGPAYAQYYNKCVTSLTLMQKYKCSLVQQCFPIKEYNTIYVTSKTKRMGLELQYKRPSHMQGCQSGFD